MLRWLPEDVSTYGHEIDSLFFLIYYITAATFILVTVLMVLFLVMYRERPGRRATYSHGNTTLEIIWTIIPAAILIVLSFMSVNTWAKLKNTVPPSDFAIQVTASFFIPNLRFKQDMVPGRTVTGWFEATKPGRYELPCAELCGFGHSGMKGWLHVHSAEDYAKWAAENLAAKQQ